MLKIVGLDEAFDSIQDGMRIYTQGMASTPHALLGALAKRARALHDVTVYHLHLEGETPWVGRDMRPHIHDVSLFVGPNLRHAVNSGLSDYVPIFLSETPWFLRQEAFRPQVALINVSPPDQHGFVSLGPTIEAVPAAIALADIVIAQINPAVPRTLGDALIHTRDITFGVAVDSPLDTHQASLPESLARTIARHVAGLIPDRATLQAGIGKIPDAILGELTDHRDLGIHSEMISDGVRILSERGIITGRYKGTDPGKIVATFCMGSPALYRFIDDNPEVELRSVEYTNSTAVIRQNPRMISLNSALEVDLTGQVAAEAIGTQIVSGVGGQMDFVRGASLSPGGASIIALPSRTHSGAARIVPYLKPGAAVTTTRNHVQYVVTEYGVAELHGKTIRARAKALVGIAHPDDRSTLEEAAHKL